MNHFEPANGHTIESRQAVIDRLADDLGLEVAEDDGRRRVKAPLVYERRGERSYYHDLFLSSSDRAEAPKAGERLEEHRRQMDEMEKRVNPNLETGHGLEFAPPLWLNEYFATGRRAGQIIQRLAHEFELPRGVSSVKTTRMTQGTLVNDQAPGGPTDNQDVETAEVEARVIQYSGESDWAIQALEQSPQGAHLDWVIFTDMAESLDASLEEDFIAGKGKGVTEALGLLNITGINAISDSSTEVKELFESIGKAIAKVGIERKRPPDAILMGTAKLAQLSLAVEKESRPLVLTDQVGKDWPPASLAGFSVYPDDAITRTYEKTQEPIFAVRSDDFLLWHGAPTTMVMEKALSGTLQVRFALWRNTATMLHRYPSGISAITGSGLKPATGY